VMECVPPQTAIQLCSGPASEEEPSAWS
jgi:hypothetical protein